MKKTLSTKILAVFLAVLMLVTAVPFASFAAGEESTEAKAALADLQEKVDAYTKKMDGSVFKNMSPAYDAYLAAVKARDSFKYGDSFNKVEVKDLEEKTEALRVATEKMEPYTYKKANDILYNGGVRGTEKDSDGINTNNTAKVYAQWKGQNGANDIMRARQNSVGVIWTEEFNPDAVNGSAGAIKSSVLGHGDSLYDTQLVYGSSVLLYDGMPKDSKGNVDYELLPRFPVMIASRSIADENHDTWISKFSYRHYVSSFEPSDGAAAPTSMGNKVDTRNYQEQHLSKDFQMYLAKDPERRALTGRGRDGQNNYYEVYSHINTGDMSDRWTAGHPNFNENKYSTNSQSTMPSGKIDSTPYAYYASSVQFFREMKEDEYVLAQQIGWQSEHLQHHYWALSYQGEDPSVGAGTASKTTYVINYEAFRNIFDNVIPTDAKSVLKDIGNYNERSAQVSKLMSAIDSLTQTDIETEINAATNVDTYIKNTYNNRLTNAVKDIKAVGANDFKGDSKDNYPELETKLENPNFKEISDTDNRDEMYDQDKFIAFRDAYTNAVMHMGSLPDGNYEVGKAKELADNLQKTYDALMATKKLGVDGMPYLLAKANLQTALKNKDLDAEKLKDVKTLLEKTNKLKYWNYELDDFKNKVPADVEVDGKLIEESTAVNAEIKLLEQATAMLGTLASSTTYDAVIKGLETLNADSIDYDAIQAVVEEANKDLKQTVNVLGVDYTGYAYDAVVQTIIESLNPNADSGVYYSYKIKAIDSDGVEYFYDGENWSYVDDTNKDDEYNEVDENGFYKNGASYHYNDKVSLELDGNFTDNLDDLDYTDWSVSAIAKKTQIDQTPKYIGTGASQEIVVRGNTTIYLSSRLYPEEPLYYPIKFVNAADGSVLDFVYSEDGTFDISKASIMLPAFQKIVGYECDNENVEITDGVITNLPQEEVIVKVKFAPIPQPGAYNVRVVSNLSQVLSDNEYTYGKVASVSEEGASGYVRATYNEETGEYEKGEYLWDSKDYSFNVYEDIVLMPVPDAPKDINVSVIHKPVGDRNKTRFVGSYTGVPEGAEVLSFGIVLDVNNKLGEGELSLAKVDGSKGIYNLPSAEDADAEDNQYIISTSGGAFTKPISYVAYVIYRPKDQVAASIAYSDVQTNVQVDYCY